MYPDSNFARPVSSFRRPAPITSVDPDDNPDLTVCFRREWLPYIIGSLRQLLLQTTWDTSDPDALNKAQGQAQLLISMFIQGCDVDQSVIEAIGGLDEDIELSSLCEMLRYQNGKLQAYCCGTWVDISGQPSQGWASAQSAQVGAPQPSVGGCQSYHATLSGNGLFYLPTIVNTGDTIQVTNLVGATYNPATAVAWFCGDGGQFFAGANVGFPVTAGGNPMPAVPSGTLIAKIGANYYDVHTGTFTVPAGITSQPVVFQVNYASITGSAGSLQFDVNVCNNALATWSKVFDFTTNPYTGSWVITTQGNNPAGPSGVYVAGVGYQTGLAKFNTGQWFRCVALTNLKTFAQTSIKTEFAFTPGAYNGRTTDQTFLYSIGGAAYNSVNMPTTPTTPQIHTANDAIAANETALIQCGWSGAAADPGGQITLTKITITGTGTQPAW